MIGKLAVYIFNLKAKAIMKTAAKDPRFKSALEDYVKGTNEFRKKLKETYGVTDLDKLPRI
jgi:acyl-homoserine lactone acylase PvdQ